MFRNCVATAFRVDFSVFSAILCGYGKQENPFMTEKATMGLSHSAKRAALIAASLSAFLGTFMGSSVNIALPTIGRQFQMNPIALSWIQTSYLLSAAVFLIPFGRLADMLGRRRVFMQGIILYTAISCLIAVSISGLMVILGRIIQGVASAMVFATGTAILMDVYPPNERGKALGITVGSVYLGLTLGPIVGGAITQYLGWRSIFWLNLPLGLVVITFLVIGLKPEKKMSTQGNFDYFGSLALAVSLCGLIYGLTKIPSLAGFAIVGVGLVAFVGFLYQESHVGFPLIDLRLFRNNRVFAYSNLAALINYSTTAGVGFLMSLYLQYNKGLSPREAGMVMVSQPLVQTIFAPYAGRLSDKIEPRLVASFGMLVTLVGLLLLAFIGQASAWWFIIFCLGLLGLGIALFSSPNTNAVMSSVDKRHYGIASAIVGSMRLVGQMSSMAIVMLIFALVFGKTKMTPEHYSYLIKSARIAFLIFAVLCVGGIMASLARGDLGRNNESKS